MSKSAWATKKVKNWFVRKIKKEMPDNKDLMEKVAKMPEEEFKEYIKFEDKEAMEKFLAGEIIKTELVKDAK